MEKKCLEELIKHINSLKEKDVRPSLQLFNDNYKTILTLWRTINALEDLSDEVLPGLVKNGYLSEEAMNKLKSAKWQIVEELEPLAHEALKIENKYMLYQAAECKRHLILED